MVYENLNEEARLLEASVKLSNAARGLRLLIEDKAIDETYKTRIYECISIKSNFCGLS